MAYLSKSTLLATYTQLAGLTDDPNSQGATQYTSAIRYFFALDEFLKKYHRPCNTQSKTDKDAFVAFVGNVVAVNEEYYTANFYNSLKTNSDYAVGSNFFSVNTVKNSLENSSKEYDFPKRSGWPALFVIKDGLLEEREDLLKNITYYLNSPQNRVAFALWLCRKMVLEPSNLYWSLKNMLLERYSTSVVDFLLPSKDCLQGIEVKWASTPVEFAREDFPQQMGDLEVKTKSELLPLEELAKKVKKGFIKFWKLIDQHGVDFDTYVNNFENAINPYLIKLRLGYDNIFQIVDYKSYNSIIQRITSEYPEMEYVKNGRQNSGVRYPIGSTHVHYSNYLQVLDNSDFRANIDKGQEECQRERLLPLLDQPLQLIYYGAPGTGKSFAIDQVTNENNSVRTTFHPDSDYAGFVGAYKPTMALMPVNAFVGTTVHHAKNADNEKVYEKRIVYKYVPQAFLKAYVEAWKRYVFGEDNPYYLVIEEINRGNCAQIFGDLFQLLDRNNMGCSSYAISADEDIAQFLREDEKGFGNLSEDQRNAIRNFRLKKAGGAEESVGEAILNGSKILLPPNLRIWATMNTSDQSLFPIDSAFKRRWNWKYIPIEYDPIDKNSGEHLSWKLEVRGKTYYWGQFLEFINPKILKLTLSEDKQMGYFFAKPDKKGSNGKLDTISEKVFVNKVLFYLWSDVFKDYALTEDPFVYEKEDSKVKTPYRFTDFFSTKGGDMLANFVAGFKLTLVGEHTEDKDVAFDSDEDADLNDNENENARDYSKYSVNGTGYYSKSDAVVEVVKALVASNPEATANEIIEKVRSFNLSYTFVYLEVDYKYNLDRSSDVRFAKRYASIKLNDGESIYIYRGSTPARMGELINGLNNSGSGISLSKVE